MTDGGYTMEQAKSLQTFGNGRKCSGRKDCTCATCLEKFIAAEESALTSKGPTQ